MGRVLAGWKAFLICCYADTPKCMGLHSLDGLKSVPARSSIFTHGWAQASEHERALREFVCRLCKGVLTEPLSTPCGHHFCKPCLAKKFEARRPWLPEHAATQLCWNVKHHG